MICVFVPTFTLDNLNQSCDSRGVNASWGAAILQQMASFALDDDAAANDAAANDNSANDAAANDAAANDAAANAGHGPPR